MTLKQDSGELGEKEVCELTKCPNCGGKLFQLAKNNPLYDVACSRCLFRVQVKTVGKNFDGKRIRGAGWSVMDKAQKAGMVIPPVILNTKDEIRFYPYIPKSSLIKRIAIINKTRRHPMFDYDIRDLKYYVLVKK